MREDKLQVPAWGHTGGRLNTAYIIPLPRPKISCKHSERSRFHPREKLFSFNIKKKKKHQPAGYQSNCNFLLLSTLIGHSAQFLRKIILIKIPEQENSFLQLPSPEKKSQPGCNMKTQKSFQSPIWTHDRCLALYRDKDKQYRTRFRGRDLHVASKEDDKEKEVSNKDSISPDTANLSFSLNIKCPFLNLYQHVSNYFELQSKSW